MAKKPEPKKPQAKKPQATKAPAKAKEPRKPRQRSIRSYEREIEQLLQMGKKEGKLNQKEIFGLIPDTPSNIDVLDNLYAELVEAEVEVIPQDEPDAKTLSDEWASEEEPEEELLKPDTAYLDDIS